MSEKGGRFIENLGLLVAILSTAAYAAAETWARLKGIPDSGFPWGLVVMNASLIIPKTVGRGSAGAVWRGLANATGQIPALRRRRPPPPTSEEDADAPGDTNPR